MNILIIGASNGLGLKCVETALKRGHRVTAFSRNLDSLTQHPNLSKYKGDATRAEDIMGVLATTNFDSIVVTLGTGKSMKGTTLFSKSAEAIIKRLKEFKINLPLIVLSGFGEGDSYDYMNFFGKLFFRIMLWDLYKDKTKMVKYITSNYSNWTIVRPMQLSDGIFTGKYLILYPYKTPLPHGKISRTDVADFVINQCENNSYRGKFPALTT